MRTFNIELSETHLKIIAAAVGELPTKIGMPLTMHINDQIAKLLACDKPPAESNVMDLKGASKS